MLGRGMGSGPGVAPMFARLTQSYPRLHAAIPPGFKKPSHAMMLELWRAKSIEGESFPGAYADWLLTITTLWLGVINSIRVIRSIRGCESLRR
jgi:hypothetical protein